MLKAHPRQRSINRQNHATGGREVENAFDCTCAHDWSGAGDACRSAVEAELFGARYLHVTSSPAAAYGILGKNADRAQQIERGEIFAKSTEA